MAILTEAHWAAFCKLIGRPDLQSHPEFLSAPMRVENRALLNHELGSVLAQWDRGELVTAMAAAGLACGQVNDVRDLLAHPQLRQRQFYSDWQIGRHTVMAPGAPWTMGQGSKRAEQSIPPTHPGMHAQDILRDWCDAGEDDVATLRARGALG
jgi:crotonobetainyl-CoA:carnitine CoA-transferase CaiB-like acyl-CoA transferase